MFSKTVEGIFVLSIFLDSKMMLMKLMFALCWKFAWSYINKMMWCHHNILFNGILKIGNFKCMYRWCCKASLFLKMWIRENSNIETYEIKYKNEQKVWRPPMMLLWDRSKWHENLKKKIKFMYPLTFLYLILLPIYYSLYWLDLTSKKLPA